MQGIILQIVGLLIIITLIILFFSKPNVDNVETKTYAKLIGLNFLFVIVGITAYFIARLTSNLNLIGIFQKIYMSILTLLNLYSMYYCLFVYDKEKKFIKLKKIRQIELIKNLYSKMKNYFNSTEFKIEVEQLINKSI